MSDNNKTISIKIAIEIPVNTAEKTIQKLHDFAASISQIPMQVEAPRTPLIEDDVVQAIKHVGQKAHADLKAEKELKKQETANQEKRKNQLIDARKKYDLNVIQVYRLYRRIRPECDRDYTAHKAVSLHFDWPVSAAQHAVACRKRLIKAYLKLRQKKVVMHLIFLGWTNKRIAAHVGVHEKTIAKTFRELRKGFKV